MPSYPFHRIVAALDLEETSYAALELARTIARRSGGSLHLVHVIEPDDFALLQRKYRPWDHPEPSIDSARRSAEASLARIARERLGTATNYQIASRVGDPARCVVEIAREVGADVVVMGAGKSDGDVAATVLRSAPCFVLTVRAS